MQAADCALDTRAAGELLASAVREAGALALKKFRAPLKSWTKGAQKSPVSEVDIAVDELLRGRLAAAAPDYGWLSEETEDDASRLGAKHVWIVDPIDGTRAFIAGREDWVVSAALVRDGRPIAGAIYVPVEDKLILGITGEGTTVNGGTVTVRDGESFKGTRIAGPKRYLEALQARLGAQPVERVHSLALRIARVATGDLDIAFAGGNALDWDIAAADIILQEAGGALTDLAGAARTYNSASAAHAALMAAGRERHGYLLRLMRDRQVTFA